MKHQLVAFSLIVAISCAHAGEPVSALEEYGKSVASSSEKGAVRFVSVVKTMDQPMVAYVITFKTDSKALMATPNAENDRSAYVLNSAKTKLWEAKFCTDRLKSLMKDIGANIVSGDLQNSRGETQSMAPCL